MTPSETTRRAGVGTPFDTKFAVLEEEERLLTAVSADVGAALADPKRVLQTVIKRV